MRAMLVANAALLAGGQMLLAHATTMPVAAAARVLVGTGDAVVLRRSMKAEAMIAWRVPK